MGALWVTDDTMTQKRRNREAVVGRLLYPMFDCDDALAVQVASKPLDGVALTASNVTYYTAPAGAGKVAEVLSISLCNTDTLSQTVSLYLVESGGVTGVSTSIFRDTLAPGERVTIEGPWFLGPSDRIDASAQTVSVVSMRAEILEWAAAPAGLVLKVINGASLGSSVATYYTCPASTDALLLAATMCNTDTASRTPNLHVIHSGDAAAVKNRVYSDVMGQKETAILSTAHVLKPSDFVQAKASVASVVSLRLTVLEVAQ